MNIENSATSDQWKVENGEDQELQPEEAVEGEMENQKFTQDQRQPIQDDGNGRILQSANVSNQIPGATIYVESDEENNITGCQQTISKETHSNDMQKNVAKAKDLKDRQLHGRPVAYYCTICKKTFITAEFLKIHVERFHPGQLKKKTKTVREKDEKSYPCEICEKIFKTKGSLKQHTKSHVGYSPFKCETCEKGFTSTANLRNHSLVHSNEKPHECNICGKTFRQKPHLTNHMLAIHISSKMHKCEYCDKEFTLKGNLAQHQKIHTGTEKSFICSICDKSFAYPSRLKQHEKTHTK